MFLGVGGIAVGVGGTTVIGVFGGNMKLGSVLSVVDMAEAARSARDVCLLSDVG